MHGEGGRRAAAGAHNLGQKSLFFSFPFLPFSAQWLGSIPSLLSFLSCSNEQELSAPPMVEKEGEEMSGVCMYLFCPPTKNLNGGIQHYAAEKKLFKNTI